MFKAADLMTTHVVAVRVDDTIDHAINLMVKHRISGLPVLDGEDHPVGIVSEFDVLELICDGRTGQEPVSHFMSPGLFGVSEQDSWVTVADLFREKHVRRLPVLRDGMLVGIITRHDLMHAIRDARQRVHELLTRPDRDNPDPTGVAPPTAASTGPGGTGHQLAEVGGR